MPGLGWLALQSLLKLRIGCELRPCMSQHVANTRELTHADAQSNMTRCWYPIRITRARESQAHLELSAQCSCAGAAAFVSLWQVTLEALEHVQQNLAKHYPTRRPPMLSFGPGQALVGTVNLVQDGAGMNHRINETIMSQRILRIQKYNAG